MRASIDGYANCNVCMKRKCNMRPSRECKSFIPFEVKPITTMGAQLIREGKTDVLLQLGVNINAVNEHDKKRVKKGEYI